MSTTTKKKLPRLLCCKELAWELSVRREWVCAAVAAGAPRVTPRLYDMEAFIEWMKRNPDFRRREVYREDKKRGKRGHRKGKPAVHF